VPGFVSLGVNSVERELKAIRDSPMLFMEWPNIEIDDQKITLKSSITKVTITKSNERTGDKGIQSIYTVCPILDPRNNNVIE
jgi:hypothetical protein